MKKLKVIIPIIIILIIGLFIGYRLTRPPEANLEKITEVIGYLEGNNYQKIRVKDFTLLTEENKEVFYEKVLKDIEHALEHQVEDEDGVETKMNYKALTNIQLGHKEIVLTYDKMNDREIKDTFVITLDKENKVQSVEKE